MNEKFLEQKRITQTEREVLQNLVLGLRNEDIAKNLCISVSTVKKHLESIYDRADTVSGSGSSTTSFKVQASAHGEPLRYVLNLNSFSFSFKQALTPILCYYAQSTYYRANGEICCVRIYNRKLTDEEIAYNHAIDKVKYKLEN